MTSSRPYPADWESVADLRVFRPGGGDWPRRGSWRQEMQRRGWRLLRVTHDGPELVAVFGRTKAERLRTGA